ncbi:MAG: UvrD-helicase domain-containing protein [Clostridia bacterium]|nr:UvrD-helicase domain-containing protein [Clostridia bacterium]
MDLADLNREQRMAAETLEGPVLVLAGAGSGKTRALTYRIANLIDHGVAPWHILALTFTNKAAAEMKQRVQQLTGEQAASEAWISTFHSTCARILRRDIEKLGYTRSFAIYDDEDQNTIIRQILKELNIDDRFLPVREVRSRISDAKNRMITPDEWFRTSPRDRRSSQIHDAMTLYEKKLRTLNALDFDDLINKTLELMLDHPPVLSYYRERFQYVLVDEYQDTNKAQYELIRLISLQHRNLCVVGDDDQSIYGWRGADVRNILDFEKDYPDAKVIRLEQNYRSTGIILDAANQVIAHNADRKDKRLWTEAEGGDKIRSYTAVDEQDEALWVAGRIQELRRGGTDIGSVAILYRNNAQSRVVEEMLMRAGIPYRIFGGQKFYERKEVKDILAYLRVIVNPSDDLSLRRIINIPKRAIGETTVQALEAHAAEKGIPLYSTLEDPPEGLNKRARGSLQAFAELMTMLTVMKDSLPLAEYIDYLIDQTGLERQYAKENTEEARSRMENIAEFRGAVTAFAQLSEESSLEDYLENVALVTDLDRSGEAGDTVTMMTLHSAKGLEFDHVFIVGTEENIFPSARSLEDPGRLEEERRLMYVGITRARKALCLTRARERMLYNQFQHNPPSRFIEEIPDRLIQEEGFGARRRPAPRGGTHFESSAGDAAASYGNAPRGGTRFESGAGDAAASYGNAPRGGTRFGISSRAGSDAERFGYYPDDPGSGTRNVGTAPRVPPRGTWGLSPRSATPQASGAPPRSTSPRAGSMTPQELGKPRITLHGKSLDQLPKAAAPKGTALDQIPGVTRGFGSASQPAATGHGVSGASQSAVANRIFEPGERVMHAKFGPGTVLHVEGEGAAARIRVHFDSAGERELSLAIAPIVRYRED